MDVAVDVAALSRELLEQEARALLTRLDQVKPLALQETMVLAAALPVAAQAAIERFLVGGRRALRRQVHDYLDWLRGPGRSAPPDVQQERFVVIRMRFNAVLSQFDVFAEVITQRSEHRNGVWLSGLDALAADALTAPGLLPDPPPVVCYLARGPGAAIRRARTRLAGGDLSPVAIIRVPRERLVGNAVASSVCHEVGHQSSALLQLTESLRPELARRRQAGGDDAAVWRSWERWVSEVVADLYSIGSLGIASTLGLLAVVSLPRYFVFRPSNDDPHPIPYIRVLLSAAIGDELYPHPQWTALAATWRSMYPVADLPPARQLEFARLEAGIPAFARMLVEHRPASLRGRTLRQAFPIVQRRPERLLALFRRWNGDLGVLARQPPTLVFAVVGQARAAHLLTPEAESALLSTLLQAWALRSSLAVTEVPTTAARPAVPA
jgi:hypothetical protein